MSRVIVAPGGATPTTLMTGVRTTSPSDGKSMVRALCGSGVGSDDPGAGEAAEGGAGEGVEGGAGEGGGAVVLSDAVGAGVAEDDGDATAPWGGEPPSPSTHATATDATTSAATITTQARRGSGRGGGVRNEPRGARPVRCGASSCDMAPGGYDRPLEGVRSGPPSSNREIPCLTNP